MKCKNCGIEFESTRGDAKFCSVNCRVTFSRKGSVVTDNVTLNQNPVTDNFQFTVVIMAKDKDRELVKQKSQVRTAKYWYDVPLAAVPKLKEGWPKMPDFMNGRQYFLWWKNEFKERDGKPEIHNPFPTRDNVKYEMAGESSRRWGA